MVCTMMREKKGKTFSLFYLLGNGDITFDNFVQACVTLSTLTKAFRSRDYETRGSIIVNYEDVSKKKKHCDITKIALNCE